MDIYTGPVGSANLPQQIHDYNPGIATNGLFWVISAPSDVVQIDIDAAAASLRMRDVPVIDFHDIANSLTGGKGFQSMGIPPIAPVAATVSFDIEWSGAIERAVVTNEDEDFTGQYVRTGATIQWSSNQSGFQFVSEQPPNPTRNLYSVIGHERNGVFFHSRQ
jgi:hypothetical protein